MIPISPSSWYNGTKNKFSKAKKNISPEKFYSNISYKIGYKDCSTENVEKTF
jgi:hypothetical protein